MGTVRSSAVGAVGAACALLLIASGCAGQAPEPEARTSPAAATADTTATSPTSTPTDADRERTGAAGRVPRAQILELLRDRAERIAQRLPSQAPETLPTDVDPDSNRGLGYQLMLEFGFDADQWQYLDALWQRESGWDHLAENPSSGAYGIPQSLPGSKMAVVGSDWRTNPQTQIEWGLAYISARYGNPEGAWEHSQQLGWY